MWFRSLFLVVSLGAWAGAQGSKCTCGAGTASYLWLKCPKAAPADPDPCPAVHDGLHMGGRLPATWNQVCLEVPRMECFLRRHGVAWRIQCSLCATKPCCPFPNWKGCPECSGEPKKHVQDDRFGQFIESQRRLGGKHIEGAMSANFIALTDISSLKIVTVRGGRRIMGKHELLHLYLQRAELARRDFERYFGRAYGERSVLVLASDEKVRAKFAQAYFGHAPTCLRRGYNSTKTVAQGWAINGWCTVGEKDDNLHFRMRHMIAHLLMSTYMRASPMEKYLPKWLDAGVAHWLCRLHPRTKAYATYCLHEGKSRTKGGQARASARRGARADPVEAMFSASTSKDITYEWHIRTWSWFDYFLTEDRDRFVRFIQLIRQAEEPRAATKKIWNQPPEIVDERWRQHVLGRRKLEAAASKKTEADRTTVAERKAIENETDMRILASRIRGLERCETKNMARSLLKLADQHASDRVHEVVTMVLSQTTDGVVREYMRGEGFSECGKMGRAILCRVFGRCRDAKAGPVLRAALQDEYWLARANAARSLARIADSGAIPALTEMAAGAKSGKLRIAAMDALAEFGPKAMNSVPRFERNVMHRAWQVKVATCEVMARLKNPAAVDILIGRLDLEGGRIHDELRRTLKALTGIDRPWSAETWRKWWAKQKHFNDLDRKSRKELGLDDEKKKPAGRYAKRTPTYYGIRVFARTVGYVLDISGSMKQGFSLSPAWQKALGREYKADTRIGVCKQEIAFSIRELDPRTRFNVYFFNDRARAWQGAPVAAGSMGENGIGAVNSATPDGETNYYDAFRLVLGETTGWNARFADTPDTMLFLTDGLPTAGDMTKADELLSWFADRNRFARLKVHVIALGRAGLDPEFLRKLAGSNGGTFLHLTGSH